MNTETGIKTESGIVIVTGSNGTIGDAVMRRFAGRFDSIVGLDEFLFRQLKIREEKRK